MSSAVTRDSLNYKIKLRLHGFVTLNKILPTDCIPIYKDLKRKQIQEGNRFNALLRTDNFAQFEKIQIKKEKPFPHTNIFVQVERRVVHL